jgi:hypothetical protein
MKERLRGLRRQHGFDTFIRGIGRGTTQICGFSFHIAALFMPFAAAFPVGQAARETRRKPTALPAADGATHSAKPISLCGPRVVFEFAFELLHVVRFGVNWQTIDLDGILDDHSGFW